MVGRPIDKIDFHVPDPGKYDDADGNKLHYSTLVGSKIGGGERKSYFIQARGYKNPGPGTYIKKVAFPDKKAAP